MYPIVISRESFVHNATTLFLGVQKPLALPAFQCFDVRASAAVKVGVRRTLELYCRRAPCQRSPFFLDTGGLPGRTVVWIHDDYGGDTSLRTKFC